ncbi:MAG: class I SAM-dependent methyltransferase [Candidatus Paceibacterota bacterium]
MTTKYKDLQAEALKPLYKLNTKCRMCKSTNLKQYLDLGMTPPADQFRRPEELDIPEISYPLRVMLCMDCGLSQLSHIVDPRILYQFDYPYEQSITKTGQSHWDGFAEQVKRDLSLSEGDLVVDVGSNVGTLLESFKKIGMKVYGVDPAPNIVEIAIKEHGIDTYCDFFNAKCASIVKKKAGSASVIVGTNVFAHINDLHEVMRAAKVLLKKDGVFIFESPYFQHLVDKLEYDTIYHEHLSYLSVKPLIPFFKQFDMEVFLVKQTDIHGGCFRVFIGRKGMHPIDESVKKFIDQESKNKLHDMKTMEKFAKRVEQNRNEIVSLVEDILQKGKKVAAISAPAKGMTLLNYCGFKTRQISFVSEKARLKIGRVTPGGYIPIVSDADLIKAKPDYALVLAWNFSPEIIANMKSFSDKGGKFIIPIPTPRIV